MRGASRPQRHGGSSATNLAEHGCDLLDEIQVEPRALTLRADDAARSQCAVHALEERLQTAGRRRGEQCHLPRWMPTGRCAARTFVNRTEAGPTGSEESTMITSYEAGSAS